MVILYNPNECKFGQINQDYMVTVLNACEILEMQSEASVKVYLDGGWGVDALIGRETRIHNDIDLFVEKKDYGKAISVITGKGYREVVMDYTTDSRITADRIALCIMLSQRLHETDEHPLSAR